MNSSSTDLIQSPRWEYVRKLGQGSEGTTQLLRSKDTQRYIVRKRATVFEMAGDLPREVKILRDILDKHRHIIDFRDWVLNVESTSHTNLIMFFQYCSGGNLDRYTSGGTNERFLWHVFCQMAEALAYLHYGFIRNAPDGIWPRGRWQHIVHRDIKPDNIFLRHPCIPGNPFPDVVLGDFGFATLSWHTQNGGNILFQPPELPEFTEFSDVWALGATIHLMAHGRVPIDNMPHAYHGSPSDWCKEAIARKPQPLPGEYSGRLNQHMMACLELEMADRVPSLQLTRRLREDRPR